MALITCLKCRSKLKVSSTKLASVRCPKCQKLISLENLEEESEGQEEQEDEQLEERPWKKARVNTDEVDDDGLRARKKRLVEDDEERPRRKRSQRKKQKSNGPRIAAIAGGSVLLVAVLGIVIYLVVRNKSTATTTASNSSTSEILPGSDNFDGSWPESSNRLGSGVSFTLHVSGVVDLETSSIVSERLEDLLEGESDSLSARCIPPRMTVSISSNTSAEEFAKKIDFGKVQSIRGNVINISCYKIEPKDPVVKAKEDLKGKNALRVMKALNTLRELPENRRAEVMPVLEPLCMSSDAFTRGQSTDIYCGWATKDNVPFMLKLLADDSDPTDIHKNPEHIIMAFGRLKDERGIDLIAQRLDHFVAREKAKECLISFGPVAEDSVLNQLKHKEHEVRSAACEVLEKIGTKKSLLALKEIVAKKDFFVKDKANNAIKAINQR